MVFIPIDECRLECSHIHIEEVIIRMSSILPVIIGEDLWYLESFFKESISESMSSFAFEISEYTIVVDSDSSDESTECTSISPVVIIESRVHSDSIRSDLFSVPSVISHDKE